MQVSLIGLTYWNKKRVSYFYRTATTRYPCCVPTLGDSRGAGRKRLTHGKSSKKSGVCQ